MTLDPTPACFGTFFMAKYGVNTHVGKFAMKMIIFGFGPPALAVTVLKSIFFQYEDFFMVLQSPQFLIKTIA